MEKFLDTVDRLAAAENPFALTSDIDSFSKISKESRQLVEIIDIQDELDIIKSVLTTQKKVLKQLRDILRPDGASTTSGSLGTTETSAAVSLLNTGGSTSSTAFRNSREVEEAIRLVEDNLLRVDEMNNSAKRVHDEVWYLGFSEALVGADKPSS